MIIADQHERVGQWMQAHGAGTWRPGATCLGLERGGQLIAATMYDWYNGASIYANIAIAGQITRDWLRAIFDYPFRQLKCNVILGLVAQSNKASQRITEHFGFQLLTIIPEADPSGGLLLYALYHDHCRWLRSRTDG